MRASFKLLNLLQYHFCSFMKFFWCYGHKVCEILAPQTGIEPTPPAWEGKGIATGPPRKSQEAKFLLVGH